MTARIGDIGLVKIKGDVGRMIRIGQWLNGDGFADYEHAVIAVAVAGGGVQAVGAQPGGADYEFYGPDDGVLWWSPADLSDAQRRCIAADARKLIGTPYSFLDYAAIAAHRLRLPVPGLRTYIADSRHLICSALADRCYQDAGVQLFTDGRWNGYVTPADLANLAMRSTAPA